MEWRHDGEIDWLEARLPGARAAFSTRRGGVSEGPFAALNLGVLTGDDLGRVVENRRRLAGALALPPGAVAIGRQVHRADLARHTAPQSPSPFALPGSPIPEVDGHVTDAAALALLAFTADCLPIALRGPGGVAMLHCGWRGLAAGIVRRGAREVAATDAAIGPGIGPCCYEVGEDVLGALEPLGPGIADGRMLDLVEAARRALLDAGIERVEAADCCTSCEGERFFSHRRDRGRSGRQGGVAWIDAAEAAGEV
jgi:YfiH family protein